MDLKQPLVLTGTEEKYDVNVDVKGGGFTGQAGAIRLGISWKKSKLKILNLHIAQKKQ